MHERGDEAALGEWVYNSGKSICNMTNILNRVLLMVLLQAVVFPLVVAPMIISGGVLIMNTNVCERFGVDG